MNARHDLKTRLSRLNPYLWRVSAMMAGCLLLYYLPNILGGMGWTTAEINLNKLHDLYGIDIYALSFYIPVVYIAHIAGVLGAIVTAITSMTLLIPYAVFVAQAPGSLFRPAAFVIILSAVGAVVAMLQRSDEQRRRNLSETRCLYEVGKAIDESTSVGQFADNLVRIIPKNIRFGKETKVRLVVRDIEYKTPGFDSSADLLHESLVSGGEELGVLEIYATGGNIYLHKQADLVKTLANRISSGIHEIELQLALEDHYKLMEDMIEERTRDLEQAQEKLIRSERLAAVGELASGVGHELRNPLNVIRNCVYLLNMGLEGKADEETTGTLKLLDRQVDIANRIVTDLLDFTRVRKPSRLKVDLNSLIKDSMSWVSLPQGIKVDTALDTGIPKVNVDPEQIGRAFSNIISNAYQAMNKSGTLTVSTGINSRYAWTKFEDTGCGIPGENLKKIFEPLFTTKPKGIGLGLAVTKRLVDQNEGTIEVQSQVAKGTVFTLKLPLYKDVDGGKDK